MLVLNVCFKGSTVIGEHTIEIKKVTPKEQTGGMGGGGGWGPGAGYGAGWVGYSDPYGQDTATNYKWIGSVLDCGNTAF